MFRLSARPIIECSNPLVEKLEPRQLLSAGALDASFGTGGSVDVQTTQDGIGLASAIKCPEGKVLDVGDIILPDASTASFLLTRIDSNGITDGTFGHNGVVTTTFNSYDDAYAGAAAIAPNGKIVVAGGLGSSLAIARYKSNGSHCNATDTSSLQAHLRFIVILENDVGSNQGRAAHGHLMPADGAEG